MPYLSGLAYVELGMLCFGLLATGAMLQAVRSEGAFRRRWVALSGVFAGLCGGCKYTAIPLVIFPLAMTALGCMASRLRDRQIGVALFGCGCLATLSPWLLKNQAMTGNPVFPLLNGLFHAAPAGWGEEETDRWERGHTLPPGENSIAARIDALWRHLPNDRHQRFGPVVLFLSLFGLFGRRRDRTDWALVLIFVIQLAAWLLLTHVYARFAVPLLIPLALLAGRSVAEPCGFMRRNVIYVFLCLGALWNFIYAWQLNRSESPNGAPYALFTEGKLPEYAYLGYVNRQLPEDARLLLIGEARPFYFKRRADYGVVFNRNPFVEAARSASRPEDVIGWLRRNGYTHLLVHWAEIARLRRSYGFAEEIAPPFFDVLQSCGLEKTYELRHPAGDGPYVEVHRVR
jgi:hypothetical protein